ncbi:hypothetical protein CO614_01855 [Lysobacteraceae bacterium NML120232]|nr:hypothetical protein CO614_01855 [Xanthomonadaceae bacterium NML120232]
MASWIWWLIGGLLSLLTGILAFFNPFVASLTMEMLAAWGFVFSGVAILIAAFSGKGAGGSRFMTGLFGVMVLLLGVFLLYNPLGGLVGLTVLLAFMLILAGITRLMLGFAAQGGVRWALIFSGVLSLLLACMIFMNFPQSAAVMLGVLLAVELISNGFSMLALAFAAKKMGGDGGGTASGM